MAQNAGKIFAGPATKVEISSDGTTWTDLGFSSANVEITWEPQQAELSEGNMVQLSGLGKISIEMLQSDSGTLNTLKSYRTQKAYLRITAVDGNTYQVNGIFLSTNVKRGFKAGEPHTILVTGQRITRNADDFVTFPA